jgi:hypothetical protein
VKCGDICKFNFKISLQDSEVTVTTTVSIGARIAQWYSVGLQAG